MQRPLAPFDPKDTAMHRMMRPTLRGAALLWLLAAAGACIAGETLLRIDAAAPASEPTGGHLRMGTAVTPDGHRLDINNQYLTLDGRPWLPVMGEFHYSRSPSTGWADELRKMKAAGVDIVASYVLWNHHAARDGVADWQGDRELSRFVRLAGEAGLKVLVRIGPWAHAEARYGGIPDWVVDTMPTRRNDPQYLAQVGDLYAQIGAQLRGQLWKDGGPVIGVQLENEYNLDGPEQGAAHILALKRLALEAGLDVPLYTVTGWDGTVYPSGDVTPVFGGYPDEPWGTSTAELPPKETYAFRFDSRVSGDLGAQTAATAPGTAEQDKASTPFLGAEYGAGLPAMYRRRTVVSADDIAAMVPVQLGSGVNLLGYYMFHGGRNPVADPPLQESTASGGYNDTPRISYDFQAPLGPDGQQRPVLAALRPFHQFLHDFGDRLAPMTVRRPEATPVLPTDLTTPRWAVRSRGDSGFVFVNNHVRQYPMAAQREVRFAVTLPQRTLVFPTRPVDIPDGSYFVWPFNFDLDGTNLVDATAQPVARLDAGAEGIVYVFAAADGIDAELAFEARAAGWLQAPAGRVRRIGDHCVVDRLRPGTGVAVHIARPGGRPVTVLVLTAAQSRDLAVGGFAGRQRLVLHRQQTWFTSDALHLQTVDTPAFDFAVYPRPAVTPHASVALTDAGADGIFERYRATFFERRLEATLAPVRDAQAASPVRIGGAANAALEPSPESFKAAATWRLELPANATDALLDIDFVGDIGRLYAGSRLIDDWYYNGLGWQIETTALAHAVDRPLTLQVLPLRTDAPIYLPASARPMFGDERQIAEVRAVRLRPRYRLEVIP